MEFLNERRIGAIIVIIILLSALVILFFLGHLAQIASEARKRNDKIEEFFPKVKNSGAVAAPIGVFALNAPDFFRGFLFIMMV